MSKLAATALVLALGAAVASGCGSGQGTAATPITPPGSMTSLQQHFVNVVKTVSPSVVQIQTQQGLGSGIVYDARGDVVTNAHVVGNATRFVVTLAKGKQRSATLVGRNTASDLAVIRISGRHPTPASFANSSQVQVGDIVLALGNPLGLRSSVTEGIVSAEGRSVPEGNGVTLPAAIQTTAAINPGNSGGALVNLSGQVIGIPTLAALDPQLGGSQAPGIGFAIESNTVRTVAGQLIGSG